jgi:hypothetical protein
MGLALRLSNRSGGWARWLVFAATEPTAVFITSRGVLRGKEGVRAGFIQLLSDLPNASWALKTQIFDGDLLFLEWAADSAATHADDGVDTFVFRDGLIRVQTARYSVRDKG